MTADRPHDEFPSLWRALEERFVGFANLEALERLARVNPDGLGGVLARGMVALRREHGYMSASTRHKLFAWYEWARDDIKVYRELWALLDDHARNGSWNGASWVRTEPAAVGNGTIISGYKRRDGRLGNVGAILGSALGGTVAANPIQAEVEAAESEFLSGLQRWGVAIEAHFASDVAPGLRADGQHRQQAALAAPANPSDPNAPTLRGLRRPAKSGVRWVPVLVLVLMVGAGAALLFGRKAASVDGTVESLLANERIGAIVSWTKTGNHWIVAASCTVVLLGLLGYIGAYCSNCGSREKETDAGTSALVTAVGSMLKGGFSLELSYRCGACGEPWDTAAFWGWLRALVVLLALGVAFLVYASVDWSSEKDPPMTYDRNYGR